MRGESLGGPGSIPGMECLRSITPLAHLTLPKVRLCLPSGQTASGIRKGAGYSRSSTARERPDSVRETWVRFPSGASISTGR